MALRLGCIKSATYLPGGLLPPCRDLGGLAAAQAQRLELTQRVSVALPAGASDALFWHLEVIISDGVPRQCRRGFSLRAGRQQVRCPGIAVRSQVTPSWHCSSVALMYAMNDANVMLQCAMQAHPSCMRCRRS